MGRVRQGRDAEFQKWKLRFVEGQDTGWKILEGVWVVGMCGSEFWCGVTQSVTQLHDTISATQIHYSSSTNKHQTLALAFSVGNKVFVKSDHIRTTRSSKKLSEKYLSHFQIIAQAGTHLFTLQLPDSMHSIHPVFHVSMLEPLTPNLFSSCKPTLDPPVILDREPEYEISGILESKIERHRKCKLQYLVS